MCPIFLLSMSPYLFFSPSLFFHYISFFSHSVQFYTHHAFLPCSSFLSSPLLSAQALSGDSTINPSLGRLVLQCLCPALHSLLTNGLKPHQSDLIAGRRPNSAWGLVQASTKPGSMPRKINICSLGY